MTRKLIATVITSLLLLALIPSVAFASALGTAELTAGGELFPGSRNFTLKVNSGEAALLGKSINYVKIVLPVDEAGVVNNDSALTLPNGWTATRDGIGSLQTITYRSSSTGIPAGQSASFTFPATVKRPASSDMVGEFGITVSSDGGKTAKAAPARQPGLLSTTVRILELSGLAPTAPAGVTDDTATAGQGITYTNQIRNYALNAVTVTSTLTSSNATDSPAVASKSVTVAGNPDATTPVSHNVTLGAAPAGDRSSTFTAGAGNAGATAKTISDAITVQVPSVVDFTSITPRRVRSGADALYTFKAQSSKTGTPALTVNSGRLSFANTITELAGAPLTYNGGSNAKELAFKEVAVSGADNTYVPTITLAGVDANGFNFSQTKSVSDIIIDTLAPIINVAASLPSGQTAAKNGDTISVSGTISQAAADLNTTSLNVSLVSDTGNTTTVPVTTSSNNDGTTSFTGSAKPANFSATDKNFVAKAEVADTAGNVGGGVSGANLIDLVAPTLVSPGTVESPDTIRVTWIDNLGNIKGGCDPNSYLVDGVPGTVKEVRFDGATGPCAKNSAPADGAGTRILILRNAMDRDDQPTVTYSNNALANSDAAKDGAVNNAAQQTIDTVSGIVPAAPLITTVTRNAGAETAYSSTDANGKKTYFTRFAGTGNADTEDLQVTFSNARAGYLVQVLDETGRVISSKTIAQSNPNPLAPKEFASSVRIPIGTTDGSFGRSIRMVANNLAGEATAFNVVLDRVVPGISTSSKVDATTVSMKFSEVIASGTDFANDWYAWESTATGRRYYAAETVNATDPTTRTMTFAFLNKGPFGGTDYRLTSTDGARYEDRAGNLLADTTQ